MTSEPLATAKRGFWWTLGALSVVVLVLLAWRIAPLLILAFLALLLAAALHPAVGRLEGRGMPRVLAVIVVYAIGVLVLAVLLLIVLPPLVREALTFVEQLPQILDQVRRWVQNTLVPLLPGSPDGQALVDIQQRLLELIPIQAIVAAAPRLVLEVITGLVLVVFLSALILVERGDLRSGILRLIPSRSREEVASTAQSAVEKLGTYVRAQLLVMTIVGVATALGLFILGVPFALPLGFLAFLGEAIPIVGVYVSSIPIVILAFLQGPTTGALATAWIVVLQQLEAYVLTPFVQKKAIELSPVVTLLAILVAAALFGVLGALVAVPLVAVIQVIVHHTVLAPDAGSDSASAQRP